MSRIFDAMKTAARENARSVFDATVSGWETRSGEADEAYRRTALACLGRPNGGRRQVTLVVSAAPGEGASTIARNLAQTVALAERTVLVDANLRTPSQHACFRVVRAAGLTEVLTQGIELHQALRGFGNLSLLTSGRATDSPVDALSLDGLRRVFADLRQGFEWIVVDGPPVNSYAEALTLGRLCDGVVLVLHAERTRWHVADQAKRRLLAAGAPVVGAVLNRRRYHIPDAIYRML